MIRGRASALPALAAAACGVSLAACSQPCCTLDERPIGLTAAPGGALVATATSDDVGGGAAFPLLVDVGAPLTMLRADGASAGKPQLTHVTFNVVDAAAGLPDAPVRAILRRLDALPVSLGDVGGTAGDGASLAPLAVLGGDFLRNHSVELRFARPSVTLWPRLGASDAFLAGAGRAVIHFDLRGGGEVDGRGDPDVFGLRGPVSLPATRILLRGCAAPARFDPDAAVPQCCRNQEHALATGTDVTLLLATGTGPVVLGQRAWQRIAAAWPDAPAPQPGPDLHSPYGAPGHDGRGGITAAWTTLPRLALVDRESDAASDPGPCVELGRARRIEQVARLEANHPELAACTEPCDRDPRDRGKAQTSAAYVEVGGGIPVAVVADEAPILQGVRFEVRPKGAEIDGLVGAGALAATHLELDYLSQPPRAVFSCEAEACGPDVDRDRCWTGPRCVRLPGAGETHACFCLPPHGLPQKCAPSTCP